MIKFIKLCSIVYMVALSFPDQVLGGAEVCTGPSSETSFKLGEGESITFYSYYNKFSECLVSIDGVNAGTHDVGRRVTLTCDKFRLAEGYKIKTDDNANSENFSGADAELPIMEISTSSEVGIKIEAIADNTGPARTRFRCTATDEADPADPADPPA